MEESDKNKIDVLEKRERHFLSVKDISKTLFDNILERADSFQALQTREIKKLPLLRGKTVANLFFEPSTRTRTTFELAAKRLSADVINIDIQTSATRKGESLKDTLRTLESMQTDIFIVRHPESGAAKFIADLVGDHVSVINAGDGRHEHPTQAMVDMFTILKNKKSFSNLIVSIVGDVSHSRVARSEIHALKMLGVKEIRVVGPKTLIPDQIEKLGVQAFYSLERGLKDSDVIMTLRLQRERMQSALLPSEKEYYRCFGLTQERLKLAKQDALVMHPGPINRGIEIESSVADGTQSVILEQVSNGISVRMAVMAILSGLKYQK